MREVFLLCEYPTLNGGERSMLATFDGLRAAGWTPTVIAPAEGPLADLLTARNIELVSFRCRASDGVRLPQGRLREQLAEVLHDRRPALLHANSLAMGRLSGPVAAELGLPSVAHLRDIVKLSEQAAADLSCHTRLLAVSRAVRDFHVAGGISAEKAFVLYNGVDLDEFCPWPPTGYLHRELSLPPKAQLVGTIGQIGLRKGQDVLLRAAAQIADQSPNVHYVIVGERNSDKIESRQFEHDLQAAASGPMTGRVHFLGRGNDVNQLLNELTLLAHPARQEPLGRVLLEAAAAGVAIVATAVGGTPEIFPPESGAAQLIPPNDAAALATAMLELLGDQTRRFELAAAARRRAEDQFDIRTAAAGLLRHYEALAD
jgi:glycosyltransferase involved in cell wall biosynthesis